MTQNVSLLLFFRSIKARTIPPSRLSFAPPCRRLVARGGRQRFALDGCGGHHGRLANPQVDARPIGPYTAVKQPVRAPCPRDQIAMIEIVLHRSLSQDIGSSDVRQEEQGDLSLGWQGKSAAFDRAHVVGGVESLRGSENDQAVAPFQIVKEINAARAVGQRKFAVKPS